MFAFCLILYLEIAQVLLLCGWSEEDHDKNTHTCPPTATTFHGLINSNLFILFD